MLPVLRTGQARYCVGAALGFLQIHGKKIQLLAALAIVLGTRLQTWLRAVSETTLGPSASIQGAVKAIRSQSCSSLQGIEPLWSLWRSGFYEQFEGAQL